MTMISEYFARVGADVDETSLKKVDDYLAKIEGKLKKFNPNVKLTSAMGASPKEIKGAEKGTKVLTRALGQHNNVLTTSNRLSAESYKLTQANTRAKAKEATTAVTGANKATKAKKEELATSKKILGVERQRAKVVTKTPTLPRRSAAVRNHLAANNTLSVRRATAAESLKIMTSAPRPIPTGLGQTLRHNESEYVKGLKQKEAADRASALAREKAREKSALNKDRSVASLGQRVSSNLKKKREAERIASEKALLERNSRITRVGDRVVSGVRRKREAERVASEKWALAQDKARIARQKDNDRRFKSHLPSLEPLKVRSQAELNRIQKSYDQSPELSKVFDKSSRKVDPRVAEQRRRQRLISSAPSVDAQANRRSFFNAEAKSTADRNRARFKELQQERQRSLKENLRSRQIDRTLPKSLAQADNRTRHFATETAMGKGLTGKNLENYIASEVAAKSKLASTTDKLTRSEARLERQRRGSLGGGAYSRAQGRAGESSAEIRALQSLIRKQETAFAKLSSKLDRLTAQNKARNASSAARSQRGNYLAMGGGVGAAARYGVGSLPFIGGVMGFNSLNRSSQEHSIAPLTVQAAFEAQGQTSEQGTKSWEWYKEFQRDMGVSYMDSAQDYTGFMANALGSGLDIEESQDIFKGFSEYMTAMGLNQYRRKLVTNALTQTLGKGVVSMEELRRQMAESMAGTMPAAAKAYDLLQGKDTAGIQAGMLEMGDASSRQEAANVYARMNGMSGKTDQEKMAAMMKAVASGQVESAPFMKMMASILSYQAQPKLDKMKEMSIAAQGRFGSKQSDLITAANNAGLDAALANVWNNLTKVFHKLIPLMPPLVDGFTKITNALGSNTLIALDNLAFTFNSLNKITPNLSFNVLALAAAGAALRTKWGYLAGVFWLINIAIEDLKATFDGEKISLGEMVRKSLGIEDGIVAEIVEWGVALTGAMATFKLYQALRKTNSMGRGAPTGSPTGTPTESATPKASVWDRVKKFGKRLNPDLKWRHTPEEKMRMEAAKEDRARTNSTWKEAHAEDKARSGKADGAGRWSRWNSMNATMDKWGLRVMKILNPRNIAAAVFGSNLELDSLDKAGDFFRGKRDEFWDKDLKFSKEGEYSPLDEDSYQYGEKFDPFSQLIESIDSNTKKSGNITVPEVKIYINNTTNEDPEELGTKIGQTLKDYMTSLFDSTTSNYSTP